MVVLPKCAFEIVVDEFALMRITSQQMRRQRERLAERHSSAAPQRDIFASCAVVRLDRDGVSRQFQPVLRLVDDIESAGVKAQIRQLERKLLHLHAIDATN
jgi:hypothetical protein